MPKIKRRPIFNARKLGFSNPDTVVKDLHHALTRFVCTHQPNPCNTCLSLTVEQVKPVARLLKHVGLGTEKSKRYDGYYLIGHALELLIEESRRFKRGEKFRIRKNTARCTRCGDMLFSEKDNDRDQCSCGAVWISGGYSQLTRGGDMDYFEDLSEVEEEVVF